MNADLNHAALKLAEASALLTSAQAAQRQASTALQCAIEQAEKFGQDANLPVDHPACDHVRSHRPGRPSRINADPEVLAFVTARIDFMTFTALAEELARHFPPERRVGKSAIHTWYRHHHRKSQPG